MKTIGQLLAIGQAQLDGIENAQLESQILLAHVLQCDRAHLYAWPEKVLQDEQITAFIALIERRQNRTPIAYIIGHKEFWSCDFKVTADTLIPRPETELLVEKTLAVL